MQPLSALGRAHLAQSWEGGRAVRQGQAPSLLFPAGRAAEGASAVRRQKLSYECASFPEPLAGGTWRGQAPTLGLPGSAGCESDWKTAGIFCPTVGHAQGAEGARVGSGLPVGQGGHPGSQQVWETPRDWRNSQIELSFAAACVTTHCCCRFLFFWSDFKSRS